MWPTMTENEQSHDSPRTEPEAAAVVALRTSELDVDEGRSEWQNTLGHLYAEMDVAWPESRSGLDAEWGGRPLGDLHISTIRCDEQTVVRSQAMIRSDACSDYLVCLVTDGHVEVRQSGRTAQLDRGAFALLDLGAPFVFHSPATFGQVVVRIPGSTMAARLPGAYTHLATGRSFGPATGASAIVGRLLTDLAATTVSAAAASSFSLSAIEMLSATIIDDAREDAEAESFHAQDLARIKRVIGENLHDAELTLSDVASMSGMSLRNVQKLVKTTGRTPSAWLYEARVERAKSLLLTTDLSVATISEQVGFRDVSHFGRVFRRLAGISPGRFRAPNHALPPAMPPRTAG